MRVLVACEFSGIVRDAFAAKGHDSWSCDLIPSECPGNHRLGDVRDILADGWDLMVAHPPCTFLCASGLHWNSRTPGRAARTWEAIRFAETLWNAPIPRIAIENPKGCLPSFSALMSATQILQPYEFGDDASKHTCLWLKGLPPLVPTQYVEPRIIDSKPRWSNQLDTGQSKHPDSRGRARKRSQSFPGVARAMAEQWSHSSGSFQ